VTSDAMREKAAAVATRVEGVTARQRQNGSQRAGLLQAASQCIHVHAAGELSQMPAMACRPLLDCHSPATVRASELRAELASRSQHRAAPARGHASDHMPCMITPRNLNFRAAPSCR
jgi:hypothetical protein